jgi:hypothetical protein
MAIQRIPLWKENENWRARQQAMRSYMDNLNALTTNITSAGADRANGIAELVARATLKRVQAEAAAKSAKAEAARVQAAAEDKALQAVKERMNDLTKVNVVV